MRLSERKALSRIKHRKNENQKKKLMKEKEQEHGNNEKQGQIGRLGEPGGSSNECVTRPTDQPINGHSLI